MTSDNRFSLLRNLLRAFGLSKESVDDIVTWIADLLTGQKAEAIGESPVPEFPYIRREHFLTPAELSFFDVLRTAIAGRVVLCTKVALGDLFTVKTDDQSRFRIYTNKIDRKHVDFLLCDGVTMQPLIGIELDDSSHQRPDRRARDEFVDQVFAAARLPILHIPARRSYIVTDIAAQIEPYMRTGKPTDHILAPVIAAEPTKAVINSAQAPRCPKCGGEMILRTAKSGANVGNRFWGCSAYPACKGIVAATSN